ncbi:hypothetical protein PSA5_26900 [Pseudomonas syringae pv. actinidiae]|nr:hypothetical protein PSA5_26900 [Pseudomonas syringae pv. actinidiae]
MLEVAAVSANRPDDASLVRDLGFRRSGLVHELPGTGSKTSRLGVPDITEVTGFGAASQPFADKRGVARSAPTLSGQKPEYPAP